MSERFVGYLLLAVGVVIIFYSVINVYGVFTKEAKPIQLFNFPPIALDLSQSTNVEIPQELQEAGISISNSPNQKQEILPANILNESSNIIAHIILMGFIVNAGFKIAMIGAEIVRPVIVKTSNYKVAGHTINEETPLEAKPQKG